MTVTVTGGTGSSPAQPATPVSASKNNNFTLTVLDSTNAPNLGFHVAFGSTSGAAPATFGDLNAASAVSLAGCDRSTWDHNATMWTIVANGIGPGVGVLGETAWLCYMATTSSPISGTTLDAVRAAGTVVA